MSGSTSFRFKKPINWAYAPGLTKAGADGSIGNAGLDGNAVYFIDYELNNSYNIELAQQKLENNFTLSGNSVQISENRTYHSGDLIISSSGNCYRIEKGGDPYYTFSIHYIGRISYNKSNNETKILGLVVCLIKDEESGFSDNYRNFVPNNRQFLEEEDGIYRIKYTRDTAIDPSNEEVFRVNGVWCKFLVITETAPYPNEKYSVEVRFENRKTYQFNSVSDLSFQVNDPTAPPLGGIFKFNKTLEFSAPGIVQSDPAADIDATRLLESSIAEIANYEGNPYFLSDMSLDKMHLYNNDIKHIVTKQDDKTYVSLDGISSMKEVYDENIVRRHSVPERSWPDDGTTDVLVPAVYSSYNGSYSSLSDINWRGGESTYFSSYDEDVVKMIYEFIEKAQFRIIQRNTTTGVIKTIEVTPEIKKLPEV